MLSVSGRLLSLAVPVGPVLATLSDYRYTKLCQLSRVNLTTWSLPYVSGSLTGVVKPVGSSLVVSLDQMLYRDLSVTDSLTVPWVTDTWYYTTPAICIRIIVYCISTCWFCSNSTIRSTAIQSSSSDWYYYCTLSQHYYKTYTICARKTFKLSSNSWFYFSSSIKTGVIQSCITIKAQ